MPAEILSTACKIFLQFVSSFARNLKRHLHILPGTDLVCLVATFAYGGCRQTAQGNRRMPDAGRAESPGFGPGSQIWPGLSARVRNSQHRTHPFQGEETGSRAEASMIRILHGATGTFRPRIGGNGTCHGAGRRGSHHRLLRNDHALTRRISACWTHDVIRRLEHDFQARVQPSMNAELHYRIRVCSCTKTKHQGHRYRAVCLDENGAIPFPVCSAARTKRYSVLCCARTVGAF